MNKIFETFKKHKYAIIWTICYVAFMWSVLQLLFHFDMFSATHWHHLRHAHLRGFAGFVFGILILSSAPIYIATTMLITRTKKPLFTVPPPKIAKAVWTHMQPTLINPPTPEPDTTEQDTEPEPPQPEPLPDELPPELRTAYLNSRMKRAPEQQSAFNKPMAISNIPTLAGVISEPTPEIDTIPLPSDFDIEPDDSEDFFSQAPTFSDVIFGDNHDNNDTSSTQTNAISEYFDTLGQDYKTQDNIIITNKHAIATHTDPDFWVCDKDYWFATGKQITSPIASVIKIANEQNLLPILYLGADNIMELDTLRGTWESMGITIITDPTQIPQ